jgi:hypothetical protein
MSPVYVVYIYSYYLRIQLQPYVGNVSYYWLVCFWTDQRGSKWAHLQRGPTYFGHNLCLFPLDTDIKNDHMSACVCPFHSGQRCIFFTAKTYHTLISEEREIFHLCGREWPAHGSARADAYLLLVCGWTDDAVILRLAVGARFWSPRRKRTLLIRASPYWRCPDKINLCELCRKEIILLAINTCHKFNESRHILVLIRMEP